MCLCDLFTDLHEINEVSDLRSEVGNHLKGDLKICIQLAGTGEE